jgi:hypothetical protein
MLTERTGHDDNHDDDLDHRRTLFAVEPSAPAAVPLDKA